MIDEDKAKEVSRKAHKANQRIRNLRKNNIDYYAVEDVNYYLDVVERNFFYEGKKYSNDEELKRVEEVLDKFLNSKTSSARYVKSLNKFRQLNLKSHGLDVKDENIPDFYDFLKSSEFKAYTRYGDSGVIMATFNQALEQGFTPNEIKREFNKWIENDDLYIDDVQEKFNQYEIKWNHEVSKRVSFDNGKIKSTNNRRRS